MVLTVLMLAVAPSAKAQWVVTDPANLASGILNSANEIIQWQYANDGLDRTKTIPNNGHTDFCDISRLVDKLNIEFEESLKL